MEREISLHIENLIKIVEDFSDYLGIERSKKEKLIIGARYHDIGKIYIDNDILNKKGSLTDEEKEIIKKHPLYSYYACADTIYDRDILNMVLLHHERVDGKGYPYGLTSNQIPNLVKVLTICDSYEAMTGDRGYREPLTEAEAIIEIKKNIGSQFDKNIGEKFISYLEEKIKEKRLRDETAS